MFLYSTVSTLKPGESGHERERSGQHTRTQRPRFPVEFSRARVRKGEPNERVGRSESARADRRRGGRTDRRDGRDDLAELQLVEDGRLT